MDDLNNMTEQPRAYTADEVRQQILSQIRHDVTYWLQQDGDERRHMEGLVFSILNIFDGTTMALPAMDIVLSPHPDDKQFHVDEGDNWYEPGQVINDCMLHEEWCKP